MNFKSGLVKLLVETIAAAVLFTGMCLGIPAYINRDINKKLKVCSYETQAYVESATSEDRSYTSKSSNGVRSEHSRYYNTVNCVFEYEGKEYKATSNYESKFSVGTEEDWYTIIHVDPNDLSHIITEAEIKDSKGITRQIEFIFKPGMVMLGIFFVFKFIKLIFESRR